MERRPGHIVTFYSYKGGTGRSMALANFAWIMAACGRRVVAIDWDLEAPGLHRYFRPFLVDPDLFESDGLIDAFWSCAASAVAGLSGTHAMDMAEALDDARRRLDWTFPSDGYIDLIGAGRQDGTYSERVNTFDWKRFYELGGARALTLAKDYLRSRYDWILIDSRTGVSDTSGICTIQMPQSVVACFTLNRQSVEGVTAILRSIRAHRSATVDGSTIGFFPLATRIENGEQVRLEVARVFARDQLKDFLPSEMKSSPREYWDTMEISYRPAYAFEEVLAAFGDPTGAAGASDTMLSQVEKMAQRIAGDQALRMPEILEADRARILAKYAFGAAPPGTQMPPGAQTVGQVETADSEILRSIRAKEQLWRTSGFNWRLLLSRRELDLLVDEDRKEFGRNMAYYHFQSERMQLVRRSAEAIGWGAPFLATLIVGAFVVGMLEWWVATVPNPTTVAFAAYAIVPVWLVVVIVWNALAVRERPYGLGLWHLARLSLRGPFLPTIPDYEAKDNGRA